MKNEYYIISVSLRNLENREIVSRAGEQLYEPKGIVDNFLPLCSWYR